MIARYSKTVVFLLSVALLIGCNSATKQKMLKIFFDGVPSESVLDKAQKPKESVAKIVSSDKAKADKKAEQVKKEIITEYKHEPYAQKMCDSCHESKFSQRLIKKGKELCFSCHDDFTKDKKVIHYPITDGACTDCHDAHLSQNKFCLKKPMPQLCYDCHEEKDIKANPLHEDNAICTECHNAHASKDEKLLK